MHCVEQWDMNRNTAYKHTRASTRMSVLWRVYRSKDEIYAILYLYLKTDTWNTSSLYLNYSRYTVSHRWITKNYLFKMRVFRFEIELDGVVCGLYAGTVFQVIESVRVLSFHRVFYTVNVLVS